MILDLDKHRVSITLVLTNELPYSDAEFLAMLRSATDQDHGMVEVLVIDGRGIGGAAEDVALDGVDAERIRVVPGEFANRAQMYNAAISAATGEYFVAVFNAVHQVILKRSAVRTMLMAALRCSDTGFVYADYELIATDGTRAENHLLDWHEGRLVDTADFGSALMFPTVLLREVGGFCERYKAADTYDLRLKMTENHKAAHVANRYAGSLYCVRSPGKAHDVFDYLLQDKSTQEEMEDALTKHLQRTGAYLTPGEHVCDVVEDPARESTLEEIIASVVIPVNRRPEFIGRAIESVRQQTVDGVEVIVVVNGGAEDPTCEAVRQYMEGGERYIASAPDVRLIIVDVNNLGLCLNSGIAAAKGRYYVQLDSDDRLKPDAVEKLLKVYESDPTVGMVIGSYEVWVLDEDTGAITRDKRVPVVTHEEWTADNGRNNLLRIGGAGAPRSALISVIADVGGFGVNDDPQCRNYGEDYDLVMRISERYTIGRVWDPIYEVIRHSGGTDHAIDQPTIDRN
ncbi:MAG: glycosyltransferase, partial [Planctomycetes bacterium]|nr:glycosyltransferase [Planctomycetota bacterium]